MMMVMMMMVMAMMKTTTKCTAPYEITRYEVDEVLVQNIPCHIKPPISCEFRFYKATLFATKRTYYISP